MTREYALRKTDHGFEKSPIRLFHPRWKEMSLDAKTRYLVETGQAGDWCSARSLLARHKTVVMRNRKQREYLRNKTNN